MKWEEVCLPKEYGGLGLRTTTAANQAFLAKLGWQLEQGGNSLWADVFRHKYLKVDLDKNSSDTWKSIFSARCVVEEGIGREVKNGETTLFWLDRWLNFTPLAIAATGIIPPEERMKNVAEYWDEGGWSWNLLAPLLPPDLMQEVARYTLTPGQNDAAYWSKSADESFSTQSAYATILEIKGQQKQGSWELKSSTKNTNISMAYA